MLIKLTAQVKSGDDKVYFPVELPPDYWRHLEQNESLEDVDTQSSSSSRKIIKGLVRDIYSLPVLKQDEEIPLGDVSLHMSVGVEDAKSFKLIKPFDATLKKVSERLYTHQRDILLYFAHLQQKPSFVIVNERVKAVSTSYGKMFLPPYTSIVCDYEWFFPSLGMSNQQTLTRIENGSDVEYFGFVNQTSELQTIVSAPTPKGEWVEKMGSMTKLNTLLEAMELGLPKNVPDELKFVFAALPRTEHVQFPPGDGSYSVFVRQCKEALMKLLALHNMSPYAVIVNGDGKQIELTLQEASSIRAMLYSLQFHFESSTRLPIQFNELDNTLALSHTDSSSIDTSDWTWQDPNMQYKLPALEDYFPLNFLTELPFGKSGYVRGHGHGYVLALVNQNGDFESEVFTLPHNQNSLPVYILDERSKPFTFPVDMILYMTVRLL